MNKNTITNIFGTIAGVPELALGISQVQDQATLAQGIVNILTGISIFIVAFFVGRNDDGSAKTDVQKTTATAIPVTKPGV